MATPTRIYRVTNKETGATTMVETSTSAAAVRAVVATQFEAEVCSASEALDLAAKGTPVIRPQPEGGEAGANAGENTSS